MLQILEGLIVAITVMIKSLKTESDETEKSNV